MPSHYSLRSAWLPHSRDRAIQAPSRQDPDYDTPDVLNTYAASYQSDPERWFFVTGEKDLLSPLIKEGFKLPAGESTNLHSTRFVLIDRLGRIRGYYDSNLAGSISRLRRDTQRLLRE